MKDRPLVTLALLAYNQERFVRDAVVAALAQDYDRLQIVLSDDCSSDGTYRILESLKQEYSGRHDVVVCRTPCNRGIASHFNNVLARATGEIIVVAAGDDISLPWRVRRTVELLTAHPNATSVSFTDLRIDSLGCAVPLRGERGGVLRTITLDQYMTRDLWSGVLRPPSVPHPIGASRGFRRQVFDVFGELSEACPTEDEPYLIRSLLLGDALLSPESAILYRRHDGNASSQQSMARMNLEAIAGQYARDVQVAQAIGALADERASRVRSWIGRAHLRRTLMAGFRLAPTKANYFARKMLFSDAFDVREKAGLSKHLLRRVACGSLSHAMGKLRSTRGVLGHHHRRRGGADESAS